MTTGVDWGRSFVTWRVDTLRKPPRMQSNQPPRTLNNARVQLECVTEVVELATGRRDRLILGAPCKTEHVGLERDLWMSPNADLQPVVGEREFLGIKTYPRVGMSVPLFPPGSGEQPERQLAVIAEAFDSVIVHVVPVEVRPLPSSMDVVDAILAQERIAARTTFELRGVRCTAEYPVKVVNGNERDGEYQIDTGPLVIPWYALDGSATGSLVDTAELAFIASNRPDYAELLVRVPTPTGGTTQAWHYSEVAPVATVTEYFALP